MRKPHRPKRWPEGTHMAIGSAITICLIVGAVFAFAKYGPNPAPAPMTMKGAAK